MRKGLLSRPVGWVDKMGEKVGRLLVNSDKNNSNSGSNKAQQPSFLSALKKKPLQEPSDWQEDATLEEGGEVGQTKQVRLAPKQLGESDTSGFEGPDTSSLSAFLYNLLSCTDTGVHGGDEKASGEYAQVGGGPRPVASSSGNESRSLFQARRKQKVGGDEDMAAEDTEEEGSNHTGDFYDADWLVVDEHVKVLQRENSAKQPAKTPVHRLPCMSDKSFLLSDDLRSILHPALPTLAKGRQWVLLYSTEKHGISLLTLYRNSSLMTGPCLFVAGDKQGAVFGGLLMAPLLPTPKKKYQGTSESFVFTDVAGQPAIFQPTGLNRYYVLATREALAFGGGTHFALHVDAELLNGSSGACETYGSSCLAHSEDFILTHVELWGFAHVSRDAHHYAPVKNTEETPAIY